MSRFLNHPADANFKRQEKRYFDDYCVQDFSNSKELVGF